MFAPRVFLPLLLFLAAPLFPLPVGAQVGSDAPPVPVDRPLPIEPAAPRGEVAGDKVAAAAFFAHGRLLAQRGAGSQALRRYQRAWRYDRENLTFLTEVVALAYDLNREDEATRYALHAVELNPTDAVLVRRLAIQLAKDKQPKRAADLFEKALKLSGDKGGPPTDLPTALLLFELGRLHALGGDYARSAAAFTRIREALANPDKFGLGEETVKTLAGEDGENYALMGEAFLKAERLDEALGSFEKARDLSDNQPLFAFHAARVDAARGKTDEALARLNKYFDAPDPDAGTAPLELLQSLLAKKHTAPADARQAYLDKLREIAKKHPESNDVTLALADAWAEREAFDEAVALYRAALKKTPSGEVYGKLLRLFAKRGDAAAVLQTLTDIVQTVGGLDVIRDEVETLAGRETIVKDVITKAKEARDADKSPAGQLLAAGMLAHAAKQYDAADDLLASAAQEGKTKSQVLLQWGLAHLLAEQPQRAVTVFQRMIDERALPANETAVYYYLAGAQEFAGQTDAALASIDRAILKNANPRFESRRGWILYHAKRYEDAAKAYQEVIRKYDRLPATEVRDTLRQARLILSSLELKRDDFPAAVEWLEQVLDEFPDDPGALNDLGYLWCERGLHLQRALRMTQQAVAAEPENKSYRDSLGWALYQLGRYEEAARELALAVADREPDGTVLEHWGDVHAKLGKTDEAKAIWRKAADAYEKDGEKEDAAKVRAKADGKS